MHGIMLVKVIDKSHPNFGWTAIVNHGPKHNNVELYIVDTWIKPNGMRIPSGSNRLFTHQVNRVHITIQKTEEGGS